MDSSEHSLPIQDRYYAKYRNLTFPPSVRTVNPLSWIVRWIHSTRFYLSSSWRIFNSDVRL